MTNDVNTFEYAKNSFSHISNMSIGQWENTEMAAVRSKSGLRIRDSLFDHKCRNDIKQNDEDIQWVPPNTLQCTMPQSSLGSISFRHFSTWCIASDLRDSCRNRQSMYEDSSWDGSKIGLMRRLIASSCVWFCTWMKLTESAIHLMTWCQSNITITERKGSVTHGTHF